MANELAETAKDDNAAADGKAASVDEPAAKKKRGAPHQITKDDFEDGNDEELENEEKLKQGFSRASDEVISKRKIYKVKRSFVTPKPTDVEAKDGTGEAPTTGTPSSKEPFTKNGGGSSSNPFASTILTSSSSEKPTEVVKSPKKVFGFGSASGFGAVLSSGSGSSGFGGGGGFAGVGIGGKSSGFGSSGANGTTSGFVFGSSSSTASGGTTKSLFGNGGASGITFSLSKESDTRNPSTSTKTGGSTETTKLPDKVELKTGEEDEDAIHTVRCKSHEWVEDDGGKNSNSNSDDSKKSSSNPSVQSSTQFQAAISIASSGNPDKKGNGGVKGDESNSSPTGENGTEATASTHKSSADDVQFRWMELGIGPVKILRSKSNPERLRLVQRRESSKNGPATKVILNIPLYKESNCERKKDDLRYVWLKSIKEGKFCQYLLKFKENADAGNFHHHLTEHIPLARQCFAGAVASKTAVATPAQKDN